LEPHNIISDWKRICPQCNSDIFHKSNLSKKLAIKQNRKCKKCYHKSLKRKEEYSLICQCGFIKNFKYSSNYSIAKKKGYICSPCSYQKRRETLSKFGAYIREKNPNLNKPCSDCNNLIFYSSKKLLNRALNGKSKCRNCADKDHRIWMISRRQYQYPRFNLIACKIFDEIEKSLGWNGFYATKNKEFFIKELGYFVDYYEPRLNLVIEYDEEHHSTPRYLKKDNRRQKEIIDFLKCKFFRIPYNKSWKEILDFYTKYIHIYEREQTK
jgi:hypothetical protein